MKIKNCCFHLVLGLLVGASLCLPNLAQAQGPAIITQELCWTTPTEVDSSVVGYFIFSSRDDTPLLVNYLNAQGQSVTVSGGSLKVGKCCCEVTAVGANRANAMHTSPMCLNGTTSLNRVILASSSTAVPVLIAYLDPDGDQITIGGGDSLVYGYCGCCIVNN